MVWLPRWGCDGMITSAQKMLMARAGAIPVDRSWDITYATYSQQSPTLSDLGGDASGIYIKDDGLTAWVSDTSGSVHEYSMSTAWDISTLSYNSKSASITSRNSFVTFKPDGSIVFGGDPAFGRIQPKNLSTNWDISTGSLGTRGSGFSAVTSAVFKSDGLKVLTAGSDENLREFTLSTAWDVTTASLTNTLSTVGVSTNPSGIFAKPDGLSIYVTAQNNYDMYQYNLTTAWDLSTATLYGTKSTGGYDSGDIFIRADGLKVYVSNQAKFIQEYDIG